MRLKRLNTGGTKLIVLVALAVVVLLTVLFTQLSTIHSDVVPDEYFAAMPGIMGILDAEWFMALVFVATLGSIVGGLLLLWHLHELPVHRAKRENQVLTRLIFVLALCGLFLNKTWWVVAIILAFTPWHEIGVQVARVFRGEYGEPVPASAATEPAAPDEADPEGEPS